MAHPADDGPSPAPSSTVTYPPVLAVLARDHEAEWSEKAGDQVARAVGSPADAHTFGPNPSARRFAAVYDAARTEYTATLRGIRADLETAARNLALAAAEMRDRDEHAGEAFVSLLARWTTAEGFESHRRQEESRGSDTVAAGAATMAHLTAADRVRETAPDREG
jgi:hypothetical protein